MTTMKYFPVVFEQEDSGAVSAYVPGHSVYAQTPTREGTERAIVDTLDAYLEAHPEAMPAAETLVARVTQATSVRTIEIVTAAALVGTRTSRAKARASRANGKLGGRPRKTSRLRAGGR